MTPYFDAGFLLTLLVHRPGSRAALETLSAFTPPFFLNFLHQLQVENFLARGQVEGNDVERRAALQGNRLWRQYLSEGVFQIGPVDWDTSCRLAINWNTHFAPKAPPPPLLLIHPAMAAVAGTSHYLGFDPRSRGVAKAAGLKLLPERL